MKVKDILESKGKVVHKVSPETTVKETMDQIVNRKIGALLVEEEGTLKGIITERDIFRLIHRNLENSREALNKKVREIMTTNVVIGIPEDDIDMVEALMTNNRFRHLPIMEGRTIAGLISIGDIVKSTVKNLQIENRYLKDFITGKYPG